MYRFRLTFSYYFSFPFLSNLLAYRSRYQLKVWLANGLVKLEFCQKGPNMELGLITVPVAG